jgi:tetratricopeptide (TPR) repeat protein
MPSKFINFTTGIVLSGLASFAPVFATSPEFTRHYDLGMDFLNRDQYKLAIPEFDLAINSSQNLSADTAKALVQRGTANSALKNYAKALIDLNKALELDPKNDLGLNNRGAVYLRTFKPELAANDFDQAVKINPENKYAVVNRAGAIMMQANPGAKVGSTVSWLNTGKHWQSDFAGHAAALTALSYLVSKDNAAFNGMVDTALKRLDRLRWPFPLFQYFKGKKTVDDVLEAAEDSTYNLMQAQCFLAIDEYSKGNMAQALTRLDFVTKHGTVNSVEYWLGQDLIKRIKESKKPALAKNAPAKALKK